MSPPAATYMRPGAGLYKYIAGTGACVHVPFRLNPIASLAWLGKQLPCPLLLKVNDGKNNKNIEVLHLFRWYAHTHTHPAAAGLMK